MNIKTFISKRLLKIPFIVAPLIAVLDALNSLKNLGLV